MFYKFIRFCFLIVVSAVLNGCVTAPAPNDDYVFAKLAIDYAKSVQAVKYSPGFWHQAEEFYRQARILYSEREYIEAKNLFIKARIAAEKAENSTRLLRQKNGDIL